VKGRLESAMQWAEGNLQIDHVVSCGLNCICIEDNVLQSSVSAGARAEVRFIRLIKH
jgi:hypothetical protein